MNNEQNVRTELLSLKKVVENEYSFIIPCYQRPYVWSSDNVLCLLNDIIGAWKEKDESYFIGTILSNLSNKKNNNNKNIYELIDGQQRITTLILIAFVCKSICLDNNLDKVIICNNKLRLQFAIRDQVQQLLGFWAGIECFNEPTDKMKEDIYLKSLIDAKNVLKNKVDELLNNKTQEEKLSLCNYIFNQVQWVNNVVPAEMDLNRIFSTMNTTSIQLEQTDILKSKLLKLIKSNKAEYERIWMCCEYMDDYFEHNVKKYFNAEKTFTHIQELKTLNIDNLVDENKQNLQTTKGLTIAQLNEQSLNNINYNKPNINNQNDNKKPHPAIIKFPLLLIHTYRIYNVLHHKDDINTRLHSKHLLDIFSPLLASNEEDIKDFLELLWQIRYQFDLWVVRWERQDEAIESYLSLTEIKSDNRTVKSNNALAMLQSVRYFTSEYSSQYWLTPFLIFLIQSQNEENQSIENIINILEIIDNKLSLTTETQKYASFKIAKDLNAKISININTRYWSEQKEILESSMGTGFEHYWFQKLEYLLWKKLKDNENKLSAQDKDKFKKYRITSKNSVEHVHPQNEDYGRKLADDILHSFGNLALLNISENSSYSSRPVSVKKSYFEAKPNFDSLKLREIFTSNSNFSDGFKDCDIKKHQDKMLNLLEEHYEICINHS